jgi:hypothetical protein
MAWANAMRERPADERQRLADVVADRLDVPMTAAGVIFLLLVVAETVSSPEGAVGTAFAVASWVLWAAFVGEFVEPVASGVVGRNPLPHEIGGSAGVRAAGD